MSDLRETKIAESTAETFNFENEDHTLGNLLQEYLLKNPVVDSVSYNVPHPLERMMKLNIKLKEPGNGLYVLKEQVKEMIDDVKNLRTMVQHANQKNSC